ncbi:neutral amino acid transporter 9 [Hydra vulgaris]|uniref:neutral amino acid transporter 9 n=1 Tax=Hydra vulgaris TaxID=6087 RepID=UPI001F5F8112|nr:sodium-coupled neutral amino acid transporter 9 [Hydra vulgaris]
MASSESSPLLNKLTIKNSKLSSRASFIENKHLKNVSSDLKREPYVFNKNLVINDENTSDYINQAAQYSRYQYYNKLYALNSTKFIIPNHLVPRELFWPHIGPKGSKQSSIITIFAIWNTMLGTSLLSLPWGLQQSGFAMGITLIILMGVICLFTCLMIVKSRKYAVEKENVEFIDICEKYLGSIGKFVAFIFGLAAFIGAIMVYWVLMSNFLFKVGVFVHVKVSMENQELVQNYHGKVVTDHSDVSGSAVICPSKQKSINYTTPSPNKSMFYKYWNKEKWIPLYLIPLLLPLSCFKSPTFFTKFNAAGTISVMYILVFVITKAITWGPNLHFNPSNDIEASQLYNSGFPALAGILALAFYIHNAILSILSTNEKPENNVRDVSIAYILTGCMYFTVAVVFYSCFPLDKSCIEQVFLDNFPSTDIMVFIAQCGLLFQMTTVFPLLVYIVRVQIFSYFWNSIDFGYLPIILLSTLSVSTGVFMAVFYPQVGHIIRYVGSLSGLVFIFTLPSLVFMIINKSQGQLTWWRILIYTFLISLGVVNLIAQFLMK